MYLWAQSQDMPLSPGILWTKQGRKYNKKVMKHGISFGQIQWLNYIQNQCRDSNGQIVQIEHEYFRGEVTFEDKKLMKIWKPDGHALIDGKHHFYEYLGNVSAYSMVHYLLLGCAFHPGCCVPDEKFQDAGKKRKTWNEKKAFMESKGHLTVMRECQWNSMVKNLSRVHTAIPRILKEDNEETLLKAIEDGTVYGFVTVDVSTPQEMIDERLDAGFLFPPVISRMLIMEEHLSPFMKERMLAEDRKLSKTPSLVQCYHAKQIFVMTEMVRVWMRMGLKVCNLTEFVQYIPGKVLQPFVEKVTKMRIDATYEKDEAKATTAKLFGNSGLFSNRLYNIVYYLYLFKVMESAAKILAGTQQRGSPTMSRGFATTTEWHFSEGFKSLRTRLVTSQVMK